MAASDPITDSLLARRLIENAIAWDDNPALTSTQVDDLFAMAGSDDGSMGTHYTVADLNRVTSLGCQWKAAEAAKRFKAVVGTGKTFELQQLYDHWKELAVAYATGALSVVGSVDVDDGTGAPGRRPVIGSFGYTSIMNTSGGA